MRRGDNVRKFPIARGTVPDLAEMHEWLNTPAEQRWVMENGCIDMLLSAPKFDNMDEYEFLEWTLRGMSLSGFPRAAIAVKRIRAVGLDLADFPSVHRAYQYGDRRAGLSAIYPDDWYGLKRWPRAMKAALNPCIRAAEAAAQNALSQQQREVNIQAAETARRFLQAYTEHCQQ